VVVLHPLRRGFAAVGEPHVAVCLLPGTEIAFEENVECEPSFGIGSLPNKKISQRLARFWQINLDNAVTRHDALEFPDGQVILLTCLREDQHATVLQLPAAPRTAEEAGEHRRVCQHAERIELPLRVKHRKMLVVGPIRPGQPYLRQGSSARFRSCRTATERRARKF
jgi:hypothetical protein